MAIESWNVLKTIRERAILCSKLYLLRKLFGTKHSENGNLIKHIIYFLELIDKLSAIRKQLTTHIFQLYC